MKAVIGFLVAAVVSATLSGPLTGCEMSNDGDCNCRRTPERPERQAGLRIDDVRAFTVSGDNDELPADPSGGTVEVTGEQLVIRYEHEGTQHEIVYDVVSPR